VALHNTYGSGGVLESSLDTTTGTLTVYVDGQVSETVTGLPVEPLYPPLDATGALATLLVVEGVLPLADAANAIHEEEAHLVHEAEAWSVG
jgi:hypothetical protein